MKNKFDKDEIIMGIIIIVTSVISIIIGNKLHIRSRNVFSLLVVIELALFYFIKRILNTKKNEHTDLTEVKEEIYENPIKDRFNKMCDYCKQLEAVGYDTYKINFTPKTEAQIQTWEIDNQVMLPAGYKNWLLLSDGFCDIDSTELYSLEKVIRHPFPEYREYYIIGNYIGDGSCVVTDKYGVLYELDHVNGLQETTFESFIDRWVIESLENDMLEAGLKLD